MITVHTPFQKFLLITSAVLTVCDKVTCAGIKQNLKQKLASESVFYAFIYEFMIYFHHNVIPTHFLLHGHFISQEEIFNSSHKVNTIFLKIFIGIM